MDIYIGLFIIYGLLGWCVEVLYVGFGTGHFYNRGFLHMPFLPIYAFGALLITLTLSEFNNPLLVYIFGVIVTSIIEYITSVAMEKIFHTRWWDYSNNFLNINGRVCLKNSLLFGLLSLVVIYEFNPFLLPIIQSFEYETLRTLNTIILAALSIDLIYTLHGVSNLPIRDINIISGKVKKVAKDGKRKTFDQLLEDLENFKSNTDLQKFSRNINNSKGSPNILLVIFIATVVVGLIFNATLLLEVLFVLVIIIVFAVIYNLRRH